VLTGKLMSTDPATATEFVASPEADLNPLQFQSCPQCQTELPIYPGYPTWCDRCGWNLEIPKPPQKESLFDKLHRTLSRKSGERLYSDIMKEQSLTARFRPAKLVAFVLAGAVHAVTVGLILLGLWLALFSVPGFRFLGVSLGVLCWVFAWWTLPRPSRSKDPILPRGRFPQLYQLTDRIAQALGCPPVDDIRYDADYNAAFGQLGWQRRRTLFVGVPLWAVLDTQEQIALLGHELAHNANGDPLRGLFIGGAMRSLAHWYDWFRPRAQRLSSGAIIAIFNIVMLPFAGAIWIWAYALSRLLWYDSQRAEFLADLLAAQVGGTLAQVTMLEKLQLYSTFRAELRFAYLKGQVPDFFAHLKQHTDQVPARERERLCRIEQLTHVGIDTSHPPTAQRIAFVESRPVGRPLVELSPQEAEQLQQEMQPLLQRVQKWMMNLDEISFQEFFGMLW
jgi:Zn-dependent protease with chaperone function